MVIGDAVVLEDVAQVPEFADDVVGGHGFLFSKKLEASRLFCFGFFSGFGFRCGLSPGASRLS